MIKIIWLVIIYAILLVSCGAYPTFGSPETQKFGEQEAQVQEVRFRAGDFRLAGDLRLPAGGEKHPAIIMVHGSGEATRNGALPFEPLIEIFLEKGYAVFSWDKPGSGESRGQFASERILHQRAEILAAAVETLAEHPAIATERIGLWGISQAGWVMPLALDLTDEVAFMIVVGGGAEDSLEQMAYQFGQKVACAGGSAEDAALVERVWPQVAGARDYATYRAGAEKMLAVPGVAESLGLQLTPEEDWQPWPREIDAFFDPMTVVRRTTIPILAIYGALDKNIDPQQGAAAYEEALARAGNTDYQVVIIPGAGHVLLPAETGCIGEPGGQSFVPEYLALLDRWLAHLEETGGD